jgi:hypothetical protein
MRFTLSVCLLLAILAATACGGDDDADPTNTPGASTTATSPAASTPATDATAAATSPASAATPTAEEEAWLRDNCADDVRLGEQLRAIPRANEDASALPLAERRARALAIWPAQADLHEGAIETLERKTPPARLVALNESFIGLSRTHADGARRSVAEADRIFADVASVEANNAVLQAAEREALTAIDRELRALPDIFALYESIDDCLPIFPPE